MAEMPKPWAILQAVQARLQGITVANGYNTDAGADVRLERSENAPTAPLITLYSASLIGDNDRVRGQREFTLIAEAAVPTAMANAHQLVVAITDDIETALDAWLPLPGALPLQFQEAVYLDTPDGLPAMVSQVLLTTGYRR